MLTQQVQKATADIAQVLATVHCVTCLTAGQQHLKIDLKNLTNRLLKTEQKQSALTQEVQQATAGIAQLKASSRGAQKQLEGAQAKLQQEVKGLGQDVEQLKGSFKKGPGGAWQRAQEQVLLFICAITYVLSCHNHSEARSRFNAACCNRAMLERALVKPLLFNCLHSL